MRFLKSKPPPPPEVRLGPEPLLPPPDAFVKRYAKVRRARSPVRKLHGLLLAMPALDAPVEERLEFRNREWIEMTELADEATPAPAARAPPAG